MSSSHKFLLFESGGLPVQFIFEHEVDALRSTSIGGEGISNRFRATVSDSRPKQFRGLLKGPAGGS